MNVTVEMIPQQNSRYFIVLFHSKWTKGQEDGRFASSCISYVVRKTTACPPIPALWLPHKHYHPGKQTYDPQAPISLHFHWCQVLGSVSSHSQMIPMSTILNQSPCRQRLLPPSLRRKPYRWTPSMPSENDVCVHLTTTANSSIAASTQEASLSPKASQWRREEQSFRIIPHGSTSQFHSWLAVQDEYFTLWASCVLTGNTILGSPVPEHTD